MPVTTFTSAEFAGIAASPREAYEKAVTHGYTNSGAPGAGVARTDDANGVVYTIAIDQFDDKATITSNLIAAAAATPLTAVTPEQTVTNDGVDTKTWNLDGDPNAVVNLYFQGNLPINKITLTLDGSGGGDFTVGPFPAGTCTDATGIKVSCVYADGRAAGVICTVKCAP